MLVDLHAHFPMHLVPGARERAHDQVRAWARRRWQARLIDLISRFANYQGPGDEPSVTEPLMRDGGVGVALSVLYAPLDEMDLDEHYGAPPRARYFSDLVAELQLVEDHAAAHAGEIGIAHSPAELTRRVDAGQTTLVHAVEGGFQLGEDEAEVRENVRELARLGVAYVTVSHLFWRAVATNAPALPFLPDWLYHLVFPQPDIGLSPLGAATVEAMIDEGVLVDISHMSERSIEDTFALLDHRDPARAVPVIATHTGYRFGKAEYNVSEQTISRVSERGGVLGCILCEHWIGDGLKLPLDTFEQSVEALCTHIDRLAEVSGSFDHIGIGTDLDGYIKPALTGLGHMGRMAALQQALVDRYGIADAEKICSANALRVLRTGWRSEPAKGLLGPTGSRGP